MRLYSDQGNTVLDPFMGSGTTAIACIQNKRSFIGIEKEAKYVSLARENINKEESQLRLNF